MVTVITSINGSHKRFSFFAKMIEAIAYADHARKNGREANIISGYILEANDI